MLVRHSRIYYFQNGGAEEVYLGSSDLTRRDLSHRLEIISPVENPRLVQSLKEILDVYLGDQAKARYLQTDGSHIRSVQQKAPFAPNAQTSFLKPGPEADHGQPTATPV